MSTYLKEKWDEYLLYRNESITMLKKSHDIFLKERKLTWNEYLYKDFNKYLSLITPIKAKCLKIEEEAIAIYETGVDIWKKAVIEVYGDQAVLNWNYGKGGYDCTIQTDIPRAKFKFERW